MSVPLSDLRHDVVQDSIFSGPVPGPRSGPAPAPTPSIPKISKKLEELKKEAQKIEEEEKKVALLTKITEYFDSEYLRPYLGGISKPSSSASVLQLEACLESIKTALKRNQKRLMVDTLFTGLMSQGQNILTQVFHMHQYQNFFELIEYDLKLCDAKDPQNPPPLGLRRELEEISIELESHWVPGPYARLGFKVWQALNFVAEKNKQNLNDKLNTEI